MKMLGKCLYTVTVAFLVPVILLNLWLIGTKTVLQRECPALFGWFPAVVLSNSMEPAFFAGDLILIHKEKTYRTGDIITFPDNGMLITHRIVEETEEGFTTKGDANNTPDREPVSRSGIYGRAVSVISGAGRAVLFFRSPMGLLVLAVLSGMLLGGGDIIRLLQKTGRKRSE